MRSTAAVLAACAACASSPPPPASDQLPLDAPDTSPAAALFLQAPGDVERFREFSDRVHAKQPATFHLERTGRDGAAIVENVTFDGSRLDYSDGRRRLTCLYLTGTRLSGCREAELAPPPDPEPDPLQGL